MSEEEKRQQIKRLGKVLSDFLKENCSPHDTIVITDEQVKWVTDTFSTPV